MLHSLALKDTFLQKNEIVFEKIYEIEAVVSVVVGGPGREKSRALAICRRWPQAPAKKNSLFLFFFPERKKMHLDDVRNGKRSVGGKKYTFEFE